jgi:hypothetical protein
MMKMSKWNIKTHIIGKAYDLTQDNMNAMIRDVEALLKHIDNMSCCCAGCQKHNQDLPVITSNEGEAW